MSNEFKHGQRRSRHFWTPVWLSLGIFGMGASFLLGGALVTDEWSRQDNARLAPYKPGGLFAEPGAIEPTATARGDGAGGAPGTGETSPLKPASVSDLVWKSPASALEWAAEGVKHDRIEFAIYRNLLRAALAQQDASAHAMAFRSIRDVLQYGGAVADDLKAELKGMAPQVFITTTTTNAGVAAGEALEKELRNVGMTVVSREKTDPAQIGGSKVACYGAETCKDAKGLVVLLRGKGYDVREADASSRSEDNSDDMAASLYGAKVIRVALMDPKQTPSVAPPSVASIQKLRPRRTAHHPRPSPRAVQTATRQ